MIDTTTVSGISTAGQVAQVSSPSPVATVQPPARSDSSGAHDPSLAKRERRVDDDKPAYRPGEDRADDTRRAEDDKQHEQYQSLREKVAQETELRIERDTDTGRIIFQTIRSSTGEVIRQVPSEQMVSLAKSIREAQGLLVDQDA